MIRFLIRLCGCVLVASPLGAEPVAPVPGQDFTMAKPPLAMIWVVPGSFVMRATHEIGDTTRVTLTRGYWLGRTEVTQAQWQAVIKHVPVPSFFKGSERPVEQVSWDTAILFCQRLNEQEAAAGRLPDGYTYALPTEAQWEYACRAGTTGSFAGDIAAMAWYDENSGPETHPVAGKQPNAWGFFDMHGNVFEWTADWHAAYPGGRVNDPAGPSTGLHRIVRGGCAGAPAGTCRSNNRHWRPGSLDQWNVGFRLALVPVR